jgi:hypothetical protein
LALKRKADVARLQQVLLITSSLSSHAGASTPNGAPDRSLLIPFPYDLAGCYPMGDHAVITHGDPLLCCPPTGNRIVKHGQRNDGMTILLSSFVIRDRGRGRLRHPSPEDPPSAVCAVVLRILCSSHGASHGWCEGVHALSRYFMGQACRVHRQKGGWHTDHFALIGHVPTDRLGLKHLTWLLRSRGSCVAEELCSAHSASLIHAIPEDWRTYEVVVG